MKIIGRNLFAAGVLAVLLAIGMRALAVRVGDNKVFGKKLNTDITLLDALSYNGSTMSFSYTLTSECPAGDHATEVIIDNERRDKKVLAFRLKITDVAPEGVCAGPAGPVTVSYAVDFRSMLDAAITELQRAGFTVDENAIIHMLNVRPLMPGAVAGNYEIGPVTPQPPAGPPPAGDVQVQPPASVTFVEYKPQYECTTWKQDGARKDGFTGTGSTLEQARKGAANGCARTHHPQCVDFSQDPNHTTCNVTLQQTEKTVNLSAGDQGVSVSQWSCSLGSYQGSGGTMEQARTKAQELCKAAGNPNCDAWTRSGTAACLPSLRYTTPQPQAVWACMLWKNDGARNDGFRGTGSSEIEARRNAITGCLTTNNAYCDTYAMDPAHTRCDVELVTPGAN
jgi:hypothetical protein